VKVAIIQSDIAWEDPATNFERLAPQIGAAAGAGARLIALPEMFACGFSMNAQTIAEPDDGPTASFLRHQARQHAIWVAGTHPLVGPQSSRPHNSLLIAGPAGQSHRYSKIHPFTFAGEDEHYEAGTKFVTVDVEGLRVTLFICYDLRFANEFWATAHDTDVFLVPANWPDKRRQHWRTLLRARAIENQAYVIGINRVGSESGLNYSGDSAIIDPWGAVLAEGSKAEALLIADVDPQVVTDARSKFPLFGDRRP